MLSSGLIIEFQRTDESPGLNDFKRIMLVSLSSVWCELACPENRWLWVELHIASASGEDHASTGVPPQFDETKPTGVF